MHLLTITLNKNIFNIFMEFFIEGNVFMIVTCGYQLSFFLFCITKASLYLVVQANTDLKLSQR